MNIGNQILNIRKENQLTQEEFGKLFHVIVASCLFSPDSSIRTTAIIVGIIMIGIGWYKKSKNDKKIFQYMKEQNNFEKKH